MEISGTSEAFGDDGVGAGRRARTVEWAQRMLTMPVWGATVTVRFPLVALLLAISGMSCSRAPEPPQAATPPASTSAAPVGATPAAPAAPANPTPATSPPPPAPVAEEPDEPLPPLPYESELAASVRTAVHERFTGDLDQMVKRRLIRAGVSYNRTNYFVERGVQRGATYEHLKHFEEQLNRVLKTGNLRVHVVYLPMPRDRMLQALANGQIDLAEGQLTVTPERKAIVDFGTPYRQNVNEIVVSAPGTDPLGSAEDLADRDVFVRTSSSYYQSLLALNRRLEKRGRPPVRLVEAPESLEDDDLLEMVNAGLIKYIVVDDYLAQFWQQVFPNMTLHPQAVLRTGGQLAPAIRKNSPLLARALAKYTEHWGAGSRFGNIVRARYFKHTGFVKNATTEAERKKFETLIALFRTYSRQYDVDYLLMAAQGYQESALDQAARSRVGAIGVMQVMPETGAELKVGDIRQLEPNVHAGVKYIRALIDKYLSDESMKPTNKLLMAFASYNAGPGRIRQLRRETARRGLDPNIWFGNVEQIVSARVGRETVEYVSNIFKYYVAYRLAVEEAERRASLRGKTAQTKN
jgi:membrane-bound lytic murein transglycosylase MltF